MSRPRPVYPGQCYMVTRRTSERRFFLCPDSVVNQSFWYVLGWAAAKYNIGKVLGRKGVRRQRWGDSPRTQVARRGPSPRVATRDKWARIEAIFRNKRFETRYGEARQRRREGAMAMAFPAGTWLMVRVHGVPVAPD